MIGFLKGSIEDIAEENLVIEVMGIGYNVMMTTKDLQSLQGSGEEVKVYTYLSVREDAMKLYGFLTRDDLEFFKLLIAVNGIGPKGAQAILSVMSPDDLRFAILSSDVKAISKCPGIGAKTAQRMILDLKDKMDLNEAFEIRRQHTKEKGTPSLQAGLQQEAAEALTALGYGAAEALKAVKKVEITENMDVETLLKAALKNISFL